MSSSSSEDGSSSHNKYKGIRRRKWGKWVSEIRVPGTSDRLWLGSYTSPEAAAVAHDVALYCLRGNIGNFNFPSMLPGSVRMGMSPAEVQKAASDAGLAIDARFLNSSSLYIQQQPHQNHEIVQKHHEQGPTNYEKWDCSTTPHPQDPYLNISVDDYLKWNHQ